MQIFSPLCPLTGTYFLGVFFAWICEKVIKFRRVLHNHPAQFHKNWEGAEGGRGSPRGGPEKKFGARSAPILDPPPGKKSLICPWLLLVFIYLSARFVPGTAVVSNCLIYVLCIRAFVKDSNIYDLSRFMYYVYAHLSKIQIYMICLDSCLAFVYV